MAIARIHKKEPHVADRTTVREALYELKPGEEKRFAFPARDNQFYQLALHATFIENNTGRKKTYGDSGKGRYIKGDYLFSRQRRVFNYQDMAQEAIGFGYQRANIDAPIVDGETDPNIFYGINWTIDKIKHIFVLVLRNVKVKKNGKPRKVKQITFVEKSSWKKTQLKKLAEKKAKKTAKVPKRKTKTTLKQLIAAKKKAKTYTEREKYRKAIWNKQHPRKR